MGGVNGDYNKDIISRHFSTTITTIIFVKQSCTLEIIEFDKF